MVKIFTESKPCKYCGELIYKRDKPNCYHLAICCGSRKCRNKQQSEYSKTHLKDYQRRYGEAYRKLHPKNKKGFLRGKNCRVCEKDLKMHFNKLYCSDKCKEFWYVHYMSKREYARNNTTPCKICGNLFLKKTKDSFVCSRSCSIKYHYVKNSKKICDRNYSYKKRDENKRRCRLGLPLIGEGYTNQKELTIYVKNLFPDLEVKTNDMRTLEGLQLDVYVPSLKLAFEYQGLQHFVFPNFFHKAKEEFEALGFRDKRKKELCGEKGIILIEITCFEELSLSLVIKKLTECGINTAQKTINQESVCVGAVPKVKDNVN